MRGLFFTGIAAAACCALLSFGSCSNLLETKSNENNSKTETTDFSKGSVQIRLGSQARYIPAAEYDLASVDEWTVGLYEQSAESGEYASSAAYTLTWSDGASYPPSLPSLERLDDGKTLAVANIPTGTYKISIKGSYTIQGDTIITVTGASSGVKIAQGQNTPITILVGLAKEENGSGGLSLTLTNTDASNYFSMIESATATLAPRSSSGTAYSTSDNSPVISLASGDNGYVLSADNSTIKSGWYTLSIECDGYSFSLSDTEIEIADGIVTTGTIAVTVRQSKTYYATNDTSASGNGLSSLSRINLTELLTNFGSSFPEESNISIYVDGNPEINLYALSLAEEAMAAKESEDKIVTVYNASSSTALGIYVNSSEATDGGAQTYTAHFDISDAITVTADKDADGNEYKTLDADYITVDSGSSYTVTLKDGAAVSIASDVSNGLTGALGICAITEDENGNITDNFGAYLTSPFITSAVNITSNIVLYDKNGNEPKYRLVTTQADSAYEYTVTDTFSVALSTVSAYSEIETSGKITYTVSSETELNLLASLCNSSDESAPFDGVTVVLESDIALSCDEDNPFTPIGTYLHTFAGTFDGQGHRISNLFVSSSDNAGLFAVLNGGAIRNLTVEGAVFSREGSSATKYGTGAIAGYALDTAVIENCVANVTIKGDDRANVGGICGIAAGATVIRNCVNAGNITSSVEYTGGIAGKAEVSSSKAPAIYNCANFGEIRGTGNVGGIAGSTPGDVAVCFNEGRVYGKTRGTAAAIANVSGTEADYYTGCYYYSHSYSSYSSYSYSVRPSQGFVSSSSSSDNATGIDTGSLDSIASLLTAAAQASAYSENCGSWDKTLRNETFSGNYYDWPVCADCGDGFAEYDLTASGNVALKIYSRDELEGVASALSSGESLDLVISQTLAIETNFTSIPQGATVTINRNSGFNGQLLDVTDNVSVGATTITDAAGRGTLVLDGGSVASDDPLAGTAGGLYCNVVFRNANCNYRGGAVKGGESNNLRFYNCTFENCYSNSYGGAVCILGDSSYSDPQGIVNCTFINCTAGQYGGAIYCFAANANRSVYITNCTFTDCTAASSGNNIYATGSVAGTGYTCSLYYSETEEVATAAERGTSSSPVTK